jgi:hypothetical protein
MEELVMRMASISVAALVILMAACRSSQTASAASEAKTDGGPPATLSGSPAAQAGAGGVAWVTLRDSREQAFSIQVPQGWKVAGGMFRYKIVYPRPTVDMTSPDGMTNVRVGDATIPNYQTPNLNPYLPKTAGGPPVANYAAGDVFAGKYGQARFGSMCQSLQLKSSQTEQPKYSQQVQGYVQATAGIANFSCTLNGKPMTGYVYAETMLVKGAFGQPSTWYVTALGSYLAPAAQAQAASAILQYSASTLTMNPNWTAWQKYLVAMGTRINLNTAQKTKEATDAMNAREAQWRKMMAGETDDFNDILNGTTFTLDPTTGQQYEVPTGPGGQKWMDDQNHVASAAMQPGPAYHALQTIGHQQ